MYHAWVLDDPVMANNTDKCESQITIYPFNTCIGCLYHMQVLDDKIDSLFGCF